MKAREFTLMTAQQGLNEFPGVYCWYCGYQLRGDGSGPERCAECGRRNDEQVDQFRPFRPRRQMPSFSEAANSAWKVAIVAALCGIGATLALAAFGGRYPGVEVSAVVLFALGVLLGIARAAVIASAIAPRGQRGPLVARMWAYPLLWGLAASLPWLLCVVAFRIYG